MIGGKTKEYRIVLNQEKLSTLRINPQEIEDAFQQTDFIRSNGYIIDYKRLYLTVTDATIRNKEELENLVLFNDATRKIKVRDIAKVEVAEQTEYVKIKADGMDIPLVAVLKQPNANLIDAATNLVGSQIQVDAQLCQDIGTSAL